MEDVIQALGLSCLLVADAGLGTINSVGLTAEYMRSRGIPVKGIILNRFHPGDGMEEDNRVMCEALTGLKVLACVKVGDDQLDLDELMTDVFILDLDTKNLCKEDCQGLCPGCGADLNVEPCRCKKEVDPRLAGLAKFFDE